LPLDNQERESIPWQSFVAHLRFETPRPASFSQEKGAGTVATGFSLSLSFCLLKPSPAEVCPESELLHRIHFPQPIRPLQHFPRLAAIGWTDNPVLVHHVQNPRGATVAQAQTSLQRRSRRLAHL